ncbi:hypothetical protein Tco_0500769 [Tanacetum coccineum]
MMTDHNSSDLAPQRQEMSVENVSSGLVPQGHKVSRFNTTSDPVPSRKMLFLQQEDNSSQQGLEFLFIPFTEEYYIHTRHSGDNNNGSSTDASFQEAEFIKSFVHGYKKLVKSSSTLATIPEMFDDEKTGNRSDKPVCKMDNKLKWLWKNKKMRSDCKFIRNKANTCAKGYAQEEDAVYVAQPEGFVIQSSRKSPNLLEEKHYALILRKSTSGGLQFLGDNGPSARRVRWRICKLLLK